MEDAAQIVRALAVNRHCGNKVRIIVEVLEPATQTCAVWDETESGAIEVICPAKIHYKMLSRRLLSLYPLPCPLICNLFVLSWLCFFCLTSNPAVRGHCINWSSKVVGRMCPPSRVWRNTEWWLVSRVLWLTSRQFGLSIVGIWYFWWYSYRSALFFWGMLLQITKDSGSMKLHWKFLLFDKPPFYIH